MNSLLFWFLRDLGCRILRRSEGNIDMEKIYHPDSLLPLVRAVVHILWECWENSIFRCKWSIYTKSSTGGFKLHCSLFSVIYDADQLFYFRPVSKVFITAFPFFNKAFMNDWLDLFSHLHYTRSNTFDVGFKEKQLMESGTHQSGALNSQYWASKPFRPFGVKRRAHRPASYRWVH